MRDSISLSPEQRKSLVKEFRRQKDPRIRLRLHILLLLADGHSWSLVASVLFCSTATIARSKSRYEKEGLEGLLAKRQEHPRLSRWPWLSLEGLKQRVVDWVLSCSPRDFGFLRSRWTCSLVVFLLSASYGVAVGRESVRRWLHESQLVWRRPRPVLRRQDPQGEEKLQALRQLLANLTDEETAVFEDEVDIDLNPKIGSMWMAKGEQAEVETPGTNQKRYLAGSLHWRTGALIWTVGTRRNGELFERHLDDLRHRLRCYRKIHVICDNARFHDSKRIREYVQRHGGRIEIHFLPAYAPETNPIERLWWHLHEQVTRNHCCWDMEELMGLVTAWLDSRQWYRIERSVYETNKAA